MHYLKLKHNIKETDEDKIIERVTSVLQDDDQINFDALINEQLMQFYLLQPEQSTLSNKFYILERNRGKGQ